MRGSSKGEGQIESDVSIIKNGGYKVLLWICVTYDSERGSISQYHGYMEVRLRKMYLENNNNICSSDVCYDINK